MSKYTRKQRRTEDEFVSFWQRVFRVVEAYARAIGIVGGTSLLIVFAVWGITNWREKKAQTATEAFGRAVKIYDTDLITDENPPKSDEENPVPRFKTDKERAEATLAELDAFEQKYKKSDTAPQAQLFRAGVLYDLGRYDDGAQVYEKFLQKSHELALTAAAREGQGLCFEARGQLDQALASYRALEPKTGDFYRDRSLWDQARVFQKKGDKKKAAELYKELLAKVPGSPLRDEAQTRVALLEGS